MASGRLRHINIVAKNHQTICDYFSKGFKLPEIWSKSTDLGEHVSFGVGPSEIVVSVPKQKTPSNVFDKTFIFEDLHSISPTSLSEDIATGTMNSIANLTYELPNLENINIRDIKTDFSTHRSQRGGSLLAPDSVVLSTPLRGLSHLIMKNSNTAPTNQSQSVSFLSVDHVLLAVEEHLMQPLMDFYQLILGFERINIGADDTIEDGLIVNTNGSGGMKMKAMEHWKCNGHSFESQILKTKVVLAQSLDPTLNDQITQFIQNHASSGVQHVALHTNDILNTVCKLRESGVDFLSIPENYYKNERRKRLIESLGYSVQALQDNSILIDFTEDGYLMQTFTTPLFPTDRTLFFEVIQRNGASGFGEGNIKALWEAVYNYSGT
jgi:hypothetical protein